MRIFLDLDGVVCDFLGKAGELIGEDLKSHADWEKYRAEAWEAINKLKKDYWANLEWTPDGQQLWEHIAKYNVTVLSAYPYYKPNRKHAYEGKLAWIGNNLGAHMALEAIICLAVEKQRYSRRNRILIDDSVINIAQWRGRGGIGILHTSTESTLKQLKKLGL